MLWQTEPMSVAPFPAISRPNGAYLLPQFTRDAVLNAIHGAIELLEGSPMDCDAEIRLLRAAQQAMPPAGSDVLVSSAEHHVIAQGIAHGLHQLCIAGFTSAQVAPMREAYELFRVPDVERAGAPR